MRILYVDLEREWRGGQDQALLTVRGLRACGQDAELVAVRDSPLACRAQAAGVPVHGVLHLGSRLGAAWVIRKLTENSRYELAHLNEPHALTAAWMAGAHTRLPLLLSRRIGFPLRRNVVSRARYGAVRRFVANCHAVARSLMDSGISAERIAIVNEGIEVPPPPTPETRCRAREHWGVEKNEFLFGCVGVLVPEKGQRHLIAALARVRREYPQARLLLAGDGPCRPELEKLAKDSYQMEAVRFTGFVEDVEQVYAGLDAFLFPSEFEGTGTSLQAAMAWGLPAVSTARGGLAEVVDNGRTALVVEPGGNEFAEAMLRLLGDERLREALSRAGREEVEQRFSAARMVENTLRVYEDVCGPGKAVSHAQCSR